MFVQQLELSRDLNVKLGVGIGAFQGLANVFLNGIVLGSLFAGGLLISLGELRAGDLMSFLVATQVIERQAALFVPLMFFAISVLSFSAFGPFS